MKLKIKFKEKKIGKAEDKKKKKILGLILHLLNWNLGINFKNVHF